MASTFRGAPLSKALAISSLSLFALLSVVPTSIFSLSSASQIYSSRPQLARLLTSALIPDPNFGSLVIAFLIYQLRVLERALGTPKFAVFFASSTLFAAATRAALIAAPIASTAGLASGPLHVVFGLLPLYFCAHLTSRARAPFPLRPRARERRERGPRGLRDFPRGSRD
jgi:membrane associated rhomboid family serine protease